MVIDSFAMAQEVYTLGLLRWGHRVLLNKGTGNMATIQEESKLFLPHKREMKLRRSKNPKSFHAQMQYLNQALLTDEVSSGRAHG